MWATNPHVNILFLKMFTSDVVSSVFLDPVDLNRTHGESAEFTNTDKDCRQCMDYNTARRAPLDTPQLQTLSRYFLPYFSLRNRNSEARPRNTACASEPTEGRHEWRSFMSKAVKLPFAQKYGIS
jgi:hypothetical protein